jgi:peptide/nickel transport system substrate-binding protein
MSPMIKWPFDAHESTGVSRRAVLTSMLAAGAAGLISTIPSVSRAAPTKGGTLTFGLAGANATDTLDPGLTWDDFMMVLNFGLRNNLVELDANGKAIGELAESWDVSTDAKTWTFHLRKGVEFHNGKALTADDVVASINHHRGAKSTSLVKSVFDQISDIKADDAQSVRIVLAAGNVDLPVLLTDYHMGIMPANPDGTADWQSGIGTGGYKLGVFEPGVRAEGTRLANYWKSDRAHVDSFKLIAINDATARQAALLSGQIHAMNRADTKTLGFLEKNDKIRVIEAEGYQHATFPMMVDVPPFNDKNVRLALKYAIDREVLVKAILRGHGKVGNDHPIPANQHYFNRELPQRKYDPDKARYHIKQAGLDRLAVSLSSSDAAFAGAVDAAALFQESAKAAGVDLNVIREPSDGYWSSVWAKKSFTACYWSGKPAPDAQFSLVYAKDASFGDTHWNNERFNSLLLQARAEFDDKKRAEMYGEMQTLLSDDGGTIVPMFMNYIMGVLKTVGTPEKIGPDMSLDGMRALERWWAI